MMNKLNSVSRPGSSINWGNVMTIGSPNSHLVTHEWNKYQWMPGIHQNWKILQMDINDNYWRTPDPAIHSLVLCKIPWYVHEFNIGSIRKNLAGPVHCFYWWCSSRLKVFRVIFKAKFIFKSNMYLSQF